MDIFLWPTTESCFEELLAPLQELLPGSKYVKAAVSSRVLLILGANAVNRFPIILPPNCVILQLEQLDHRSPWCSEAYLDLLKAYPVWDYSKINQAWLKKELNLTVPRLQLGYCLNWDQVGEKEKSCCDVLFYGGMNARRKAIDLALTRRGVKTIFRNNDLWGDEKMSLLRCAKIILNLHYYPSGHFEYPRVLHALHHRCFVISEESINEDEYMYLRGGYLSCAYRQIVEVILHYLKDEATRDRVALIGYQTVRKIKTSLVN